MGSVDRFFGEVKTKVQKLRRYQSQTGGGPQTTKPLSRTDKRLIELIGWTAVKGEDSREEELAENAVDPTQSIRNPLSELRHAVSIPSTSTASENINFPRKKKLNPQKENEDDCKYFKKKQ